MIIDTHCHFDLYPNPIEIIKESERLGILTIGMTNLPSHFKMGYPYVRTYKKVRLALGMHPLMAESHRKEFSLFLKCVNLTSYIGEVGLDFSKEGMSTKDIQIKSFEKILSALKGKKKILSIHSRKAEKEVLLLLKKYQIENAIFHWYSGNLGQIDEIVKAGYYFSINTAMIKSNAGRDRICRIPKEHILTETDGPFIKYNQKVVKPKDVKHTVAFLANSFRYDSMEEQIHENFRRLLNKIR